MQTPRLTLIASAVAALSLAACGSASSTSHRPAASTTTTTAAAVTAGALSAEARSAATGDIPDNQIFLSYRNPAGRYSMLYPEGWAIKTHGGDVTISDKNNIVRVTLATAPAPTVASVRAELTGVHTANRQITFSAPSPIALPEGAAIKARYAARSAADPVTGKSVLLLVDRYELAHGPHRATVDLGTPRGVDNVDAYRKMIESFRWR